MSRAQLLNVYPVLPCKNVAATIEFYCNTLGFTVRFAYPHVPTYAGVERDGIVLHLQEHDDSEWERIERPQFRFIVSNVDALLDEFRQSGAVADDMVIRSTDWGTREFGLFDPNFNGLTFFEEQI